VTALPEMAGWMLAAAALVTVLGSFVKGAVGFAMPMIMISGFGSFLAPELALAGLILPTMMTNVAQAFRDGAPAAVASLRRFWRLILLLVGFILVSAQFVTVLPRGALFAILGVPVTVFAALQLAGMPLRFRPEHGRRAEVATGVFAGILGGMSGVWGPAIVAYLMSLDLPKRELVRVQGVCYLLGSLFLFAAHLKSGVLNAATIPFSAAMMIPAAFGLWLGLQVQDRLDQARFRRATLVLLLVAGANLIRRALVA